MRFKSPPIAAAIAIILGMPSIGLGRNVDLSTVPRRNTVQLTIYNSEDLTLVRETRSVTFKKGVNPLQFSWANTLIDPTSVQLRFLTDPEKLEVLDTTFPHDKPQMLFWNVQISTARRPSRSPISPAGSPGLPTTFASATGTRSNSVSRASSG